jgi:hypothetical protein
MKSRGLVALGILLLVGCVPMAAPPEVVGPTEMQVLAPTEGVPSTIPALDWVPEPELIPGPVRECIEEALGPDTWNQIARQERVPDEYEMGIINSCQAESAPPPAEGQPVPLGGEEPPPPQWESQSPWILTVPFLTAL